ncbi:hypothetical protein OX284_014155 [Flavobacterium sp. SUN046]|uniref:hypothetical protein n=1 Tax=Flavobacterium sp. SUN046 TaxID=3002440 RepID=UPI002DBE45C9|nr:hypothetical protein [Flavobacterium sp. SUN046]MEC4050578.1 hypothetical protein [Flavobacterium sp. SUN046]
MKKYKYEILAVMAFFLLVGFTTNSTTTIVIPAKPKAVYLHEFSDIDDAKSVYISLSRKGYILKSFSMIGTDMGNERAVVLIMEKY